MEFDLNNIIGKSKAIRDVLELVKKVANTQATVLITGDSGTGKELIALALHAHSDRASAVERRSQAMARAAAEPARAAVRLHPVQVIVVVVVVADVGLGDSGPGSGRAGVRSRTAGARAAHGLRRTGAAAGRAPQDQRA